ncbi:MAG: class I SAM-dependent methyltransferase [Promethearchaeota archaeon]
MSSDLNRYYETNKKRWDELAELHSGSNSAYDVESFLNGKNALKDLELREVGDVKGKLLLHLQCHFGMDTLSWARLGARVTGVDFSEKAISITKKLAREAKLEASFIQSSIYELKDNFKVEENKNAMSFRA